MPAFSALIDLAARQADTRAQRHATTLPLLCAMTGQAIGAEMRLLVQEHEDLLQVVGVDQPAWLRTLPERTAPLLDRLGRVVIRIEQTHAKNLHKIAGACERLTRAARG